MLRCFLALALCVSPAFCVDIAKAVEYGSTFKSRKQFLEKGLKAQKIKLASSFAMDGISKYVTLFSDFDGIAAAAAQARQELREFGPQQASELPLKGVVFAHVEMHARGMIPVKKLKSRYIQNAAHLVAEVDGKVIQPISKELKSARDASIGVDMGFYTFWNTANTSILTGGPIGIEGGKVELEFAFPSELLQGKRGKLILVDGDGNRHQETVDFSTIIR